MLQIRCNSYQYCPTGILCIAMRAAKAPQKQIHALEADVVHYTVAGVHTAIQQV